MNIRISYLPLAIAAIVYGVLFSLAAFGCTYFNLNVAHAATERLGIFARTALIALVVLWPIWPVLLCRYSRRDIGEFLVPLGLSFVLMLPGALFLLVFYSLRHG